MRPIFGLGLTFRSAPSKGDIYRNLGNYLISAIALFSLIC